MSSYVFPHWSESRAMYRFQWRRPYAMVLTSCMWLAVISCSDPASGVQAEDTGVLIVAASTAGFSVDTDGYRVNLDQTDSGALGTADSLVLRSVVPGAHVLAITEVAGNCTPTPEQPMSVQVTAGGTTRVAIAIACDSTLRDVILFGRINFNDGIRGWRLMQVRPDGSDLRVLLSGMLQTSVSPDGAHLIFTDYTRGGAEIVKVDARGWSWTILTSGNLSQNPEWSPDGQRIAFTSNRSGEWQLYIMGSDGSNQRRLTASNVQEYAPRWSPDGKDIVIGRGGQLVIVRPDGSGERVIPLSVPQSAAPYDWSMDGAQILIDGTASGSNRVWVTDTVGNATQVLIEPTSAYEQSARWSSDGQRFVFDRQGVPGAEGLYVAESSGGGVRQIVSTPPGYQDLVTAWLP